MKTLTDLQQFVRQHHTTGLVWAKTGSVPAGGVPPPPPPCMMPLAEPAPVINDDRSALFAEINQGENITKSKRLDLSIKYSDAVLVEMLVLKPV